jgi:hypothetical protein
MNFRARADARCPATSQDTHPEFLRSLYAHSYLINLLWILLTGFAHSQSTLICGLAFHQIARDADQLCSSRDTSAGCIQTCFGAMDLPSLRFDTHPYSVLSSAKVHRACATCDLRSRTNPIRLPNSDTVQSMRTPTASASCDRSGAPLCDRQCVACLSVVRIDAHGLSGSRHSARLQCNRPHCLWSFFHDSATR